jgi:hypothetical protein
VFEALELFIAIVLLEELAVGATDGAIVGATLEVAVDATAGVVDDATVGLAEESTAGLMIGSLTGSGEALSLEGEDILWILDLEGSVH